MRKRLSFKYIILFMVCQFFLCLGGLGSAPAEAVKKDVNNFYFESFDVDFYVKKDEEGVAKMDVKETLVAIFPDYNQNKGICREIPFTTSNDTVLTIKSLTENDIKLTRNGLPEPIYSIDEDKNYYQVCTGTNDYITGRQVFELQYTFQNVVTNQGEGDQLWQEIYWDTNGTAWRQRFDKLNATIHFEDPSIFTGETRCFVGRYGSNNTSRCSYMRTSDGATFATRDLAVGENLSFVIKLKAGSFAIRGPEKSYLAVIIASIIGFICLLVFLSSLKNFLKTSENRKYYNGLFIKPEYSPDKKYSLMEMASIYIGKKKDYSVALLLSMLVEKKIELKKGEKNFLGKYKWSILVKRSNRMDEAERTLLKILNGGLSFEDGKEIEIKSRTATSSLVALGKKLREAGPKQAKEDGLATEKFSSQKAVSAQASAAVKFVSTLALTTFAASFIAPFLAVIFSLWKEFASDEIYYKGKLIVAVKPMIILTLVVIVATIIITSILSRRANRVKYHTKKGLEASRYMDGLKLYIEMAEADRISFLQSVEGADVSEKGIVKIYEKLLPYAALFGLEKSWMAELEKYCQVHEIETPDWYQVNNMVAFSTISSTLHSASTYAGSSTHYQSSGGSGFSGGGGR
ncbi:MAG: DUF2207 domain-containing protein [Candidatus Saccharibacteria bacterium]|nr:DUF2207 domain-containing protein [Candidatus Saccharibacteria bacterium]